MRLKDRVAQLEDKHGELLEAYNELFEFLANELGFEGTNEMLFVYGDGWYSHVKAHRLSMTQAPPKVKRTRRKGRS